MFIFFYEQYDVYTKRGYAYIIMHKYLFSIDISIVFICPILAEVLEVTHTPFFLTRSKSVTSTYFFTG